MNNQPSSGAYTAHSTLQITAKVLRELARKTDHIQDIVGQVIRNASRSGEAASDAHIKELQSLDHITQSIDGLADFLGALAEDTPTEWKYADLNAVKSVKLEALAAQLSGAKAPVTESDETDGDLDLF